MHLQKLNLLGFKNHNELEINFSEKVNCLVGDNGAGKTNILDAIYYLSFCKSYFNSADNQNIQFESPYFSVQGYYFKNGNNGDIIQCVQYRGQRKSFKLNKNEYNRYADHIGLFPLVIITPSDNNLIHDGSEERRKYLNGVISQFDKIYLDDLINYNKSLFQRNALLKKFGETNSFDHESLSIWDEQLAILGDKIFRKRNEFLDAFNPLFQYYYEFITEGKEVVEIRYESQLFNDNLESLLKSNYNRDRMLRYTTCGIHKDDLEFILNGYPVKKFGSQGQQKSFLVAVKLAQFEITKNIKGFKPVLLLDDIFDKLDYHRVHQLMKLVSMNNFGQIFITDTNSERIIKVFSTIQTEYFIFDVKPGIIEKL